MQPVLACRSASSYKISLKSDNRSTNYGQKPIFKMAAAAILNFKNYNFWSRDCHRVQYLMQYFIIIIIINQALIRVTPSQ